MRANAGASATSATTLREGDTFAETRAAGAASDAGANRSAGARETPVDDFDDDPERRVSSKPPSKPSKHSPKPLKRAVFAR